MAKIIKFSGYAVDANGDASDIDYLIEHYADYYLHHFHSQVAEFEWDDDNPLNYTNCDIAECEKYFKDDPQELTSMEFVYDELDCVWKQVYATYHVESEKEDKRLRETIRRGEHFRWHSAKPEDADMPEDEEDVLLCITGKAGACYYDHAYVLGEYYEDEGIWEINKKGKDFDTLDIHGWMPLPYSTPEEDA